MNENTEGTTIIKRFLLPANYPPTNLPREGISAGVPRSMAQESKAEVGKSLSEASSKSIDIQLRRDKKHVFYVQGDRSASNPILTERLRPATPMKAPRGKKNMFAIECSKPRAMKAEMGNLHDEDRCIVRICLIGLHERSSTFALFKSDFHTRRNAFQDIMYA